MNIVKWHERDLSSHIIFVACNLPQRFLKQEICIKEGYELTMECVESKMKDDDDDVLGLDFQARMRSSRLEQTSMK